MWSGVKSSLEEVGGWWAVVVQWECEFRKNRNSLWDFPSHSRDSPHPNRPLQEAKGSPLIINYWSIKPCVQSNIHDATVHESKSSIHDQMLFAYRKSQLLFHGLKLNLLVFSESKWTWFLCIWKREETINTVSWCSDSVKIQTPNSVSKVLSAQTKF